MARQVAAIVGIAVFALGVDASAEHVLHTQTGAEAVLVAADLRSGAESGQRSQARLAIIKARLGSFDKGLAEIGYAVVRFDSGLVEQPLGFLRRADRL